MRWGAACCALLSYFPTLLLSYWCLVSPTLLRSYSLLSPVFQLSAINYQLSAIGYRLSAIGYQLCGKRGTFPAHVLAEGQAQGCYQALVGERAQRPG